MTVSERDRAAFQSVVERVNADPGVAFALPRTCTVEPLNPDALCVSPLRGSDEPDAAESTG